MRSSPSSINAGGNLVQVHSPGYKGSWLIGKIKYEKLYKRPHVWKGKEGVGNMAAQRK